MDLSQNTSLQSIRFITQLYEEYAENAERMSDARLVLNTLEKIASPLQAVYLD
ncbi:hypothetical protein M422DRAFT_32034, partial [Sphaerobolus stellatus SS14]